MPTDHSVETADQGQEERWLPVPGWNGYEVSDLGQVRSSWAKEWNPEERRHVWRLGGPWKILKQRKDRAGYMHVDLNAGGDKAGRKAMTVIRLVLMAFVKMPEPGELALHKDTPDKSDCRLVNLYWGRKSENNGADIVKHKGKHPCSPLAPADVREIRRRLAAGEIQREIAESYGVSRSTITLINNNRHHAYIKQEE